MQVVEKGAPRRVVVEDRVCEADDSSVDLGDDGDLIRPRLRQAVRPYGHAVTDDVTVEKRVQVRAAIVAPPAVGMQFGDGLGIVRGGCSILHSTSARSGRGVPAS